MHEALRNPEHRRNRRLESRLAELNADLEQGASAVTRSFAVPRRPAVFLVGCPRSGTTLLYQWLAASGKFTYPSNFVSRFPRAPWVGARIQELLVDPELDFRGEFNLGPEAEPDPYRSRLGKTRGLSAPNEFWYWWRRFLPEGETHELTADQLAEIDITGFRAELAAWEAVLDRPLLMKALILNWNLPWLAEAVPGSIFVHIQRGPISTMQSLLEARRDFFGETRHWYSFRPPQYRWLKDLDPAEQVAGQAYFTHRGVEEGLAAVDAKRCLRIDYEDLCRDPGMVFARLQKLLADQGSGFQEPYQGPSSFPCRTDLRLSPDEISALRKAWLDLESGLQQVGRA